MMLECYCEIYYQEIINSPVQSPRVLQCIEKEESSDDGHCGNKQERPLFPFIYILERFSFERRKVIGFAIAITMPHDWLKKLAPHFHPIRSKTKTNRDSLARVFPRFASATCNYYEF